MKFTSQALERGLHWLVCSVVALLTLVGVALQVSTPTAYPPVLLAAGALAFGGALAWAVTDGRHALPGRAGLRAVVVAGGGLLVVQSLGGYESVQPGATPSMVPPIIGAGVVSGMAFSPMVGVASGVLVGAGLAWGRRDEMAVLDLVMENAALVVAVVLAAYGVHLVRSIASALEQALAAAWHEQETVARAAQKAVEAVRWDGLVHDKVLGSLLAAGRGGSAAQDAAAADLARDALAAMGSDHEAEPTGRRRSSGRRPIGWAWP